MPISALWEAVCRMMVRGPRGFSILLLFIIATLSDAVAQDGVRAFRFVENIGQWENSVCFQGTIGNALVRFKPTEVAYWYPVRNHNSSELTNGSILRTEFVGANAGVHPAGEASRGGTHNFYMGKEQSRQFLGAADFGRIRYPELYRNIDALFSGADGRLKYDFIVRPGGRPADVLVRYHGAKELRIGTEGELEVATEFGIVREARPYCYQEIDGRRAEVRAEYRLIGRDTYGFTVGAYDPDRELVIDPCLSIEYLTYLGGGGFDEITAMAADSSGNGYAVGLTRSTTFPTIPPRGELPAENYFFVNKIRPDGSALIYSTVFGPEYDGVYAFSPSGAINLYEGLGEDVEITADGKAVVAMTTNKPALPTTAGAFRADRAPNRVNSICGPPFSDNFDVYLMRLSGTGTIEWGTYLGGGDDDYLRDMAIDAAGNIALTGVTHAPRCGSNEDSLDFPVTIPADSFSSGTRLKGFETFVAQLDSEGRSLRFGALYGGGGNEFAGRIAVGPSNDLYLIGSTNSADLRTTAGAYQQSPNPGLSSNVYDIYLARIDPAAGALSYSTYFSDNGGAGRRGLGFGRYTDRRSVGVSLGGLEQEERYQGLLIEREGVVYFGGSTRSGSLPTTPGAFQGGPNNPGGGDSTALDGFVVRFDMTANAILNATYVGGSAFDAFGGMVFDGEGNIAVGISTSSENYPITRINVQSELRGKADAALTVLNPVLGGIEYSSYVGGDGAAGAILWEQSVTGMTTDRDGAVYIYGGTGSGNLPYTPRALRRENDFFSGWIAKFVAPAIPRIGAPLAVEFEPEACDRLRLSEQILFNSGQAPLRVDSLTFAVGDVYRIINPPSFPLILAPCDSITLTIAFDPLGAVDVPCDKSIRDTLVIHSSNAAVPRVEVQLRGRKSCVSFELRDRVVDDQRYPLGSLRGYNLLAFVRGDQSQFVTVEPLPGSSPYVVLRSPWQNTEVTTGTASIDFQVTAPDTGRYCARFLVTAQPCDRTDTISICAYVKSGFFNISPDSINLGIVGCTETPIPTKIWNTGNDTLEFRVLFIGGDQGADIRYDIPWDSVRYLAPGDTFEFITYYRPVGVGNRIAIPVFETSELPRKNPSHKIVAELDSVLFRLTLSDVEGAFDDVVDLPVRFESLLEGRAPLTEITFLAGFDLNALEIEEVDVAGTLLDGWETAESRLTDKGRVIRMVMGPGGSPLAGNGLLAVLKLRVLRGDTIASPLRIALDGISKGCLTALADTGFAFRLSAECLAHERLVFAGNRMLKPVYPNPARTIMAIPFRVPTEGRVTITLYDVAGRTAAILLDRVMSEGNNELRLDTRGLPPGRYFCRMVVNDVLTDTREVMIER